MIAAIAASNAVLTTMLVLVFMQEKMHLKECVGVFTIVLRIAILNV